MGLSTDAKPTTDSNGHALSAESTFTVIDTGAKYIFDGAVWWPISQQVTVTGSLANERVNGADISVTNTLPTKVVAFEKYIEITRAANTTAYAQGQIVNGNGLTTLSALDLSAVAVAGQVIQITSVSFYSSNGGATTKLDPIVLFFKVNNPAASGVADGTAFTPTYTELTTNMAASVNPDEWGSLVVYGTNAYKFMLTEISRIATLDANGKLYVGIVANNAYTPTSGEKFGYTFKGYLL